VSLRDLQRRLLLSETWGLLYLLGSILVLFYPLLGNYTLFFRDIQVHFMPMKFFLARCWDQGYLPFWNPLLSSGTPFFSDIQSGVFYPLSAVFYFFPMPLAFNIFVIAHYLVASWTTYALARHWGLSRFAASLAALSLSLGGYLMSMANVLNNLQAAVWLPAILLCFEKSRGRSPFFWHLVGAILFAVLFLAGEPHILMFTVFLVLCYHLTVLREASWPRHAGKTCVVMAGIGVVSCGLAMVQLAPTWEMFVHSIRTAGFTFEEVTRFSFPLAALSRLVLPPHFDIHSAGPAPDWLVSPYCGFVAVSFAFLSVLFSKGSRARFWTVCLFGSLILAFGKNTPLFALLYKTVPLIKSFRFPEKFFFVFAYAASFLAGFGFDYFLEKRDGSARHAVAIFGFFGLLLLSGVIAWTCGFRAPAVFLSLTPSYFFLVALFVSCLLLLRSGRITGQAFSFLTVAVCSVDLLLAHMSLNPVVTNEFYLQPPQLAKTIEASAQPGRVFVQEKKAASFSQHGLSPFAVQCHWRDFLFPATAMIYDIPQANGIQAAETKTQWLITELLETVNSEQRMRLLRLCNVGFVIAPDDSTAMDKDDSDGLVRISKYVYQLPQALPRAYMVPEAVIVPNSERATEEILKAAFDPTRYVVLEESAGVVPVAWDGGTVNHLSYEGPNAISMQVDSGGGYLVVLDTFYPGWRAFVNGKERRILRANGLFKAVFLEPGSHKVALAYRPSAFVWGLGISLLSLLLVVIGLWRRRPKSEKRLDPSARFDENEVGPSQDR
jgi:hypothetical protein